MPDGDRISLTDRLAVVAGGGGAIGAAVAARLARHGAEVLCFDLPGATAPPGTTLVECDLVHPEQLERAFAEHLDGRDGLDIVVHCAGVTEDGVLWKLADRDWDRVLSVNLNSAFYLLRAATPLLRRSAGASVVFVSSINAERGKFGQANYAASKAGLNALARTAARELGRFGVRVNALAPGWIDTPMTERVSRDVRERARSESVLGRLGTPDDVAAAALFLCSDWSRHVTGQVLRVDGGQLIG